MYGLSDSFQLRVTSTIKKRRRDRQIKVQSPKEGHPRGGFSSRARGGKGRERVMSYRFQDVRLPSRNLTSGSISKDDAVGGRRKGGSSVMGLMRSVQLQCCVDACLSRA